jgi:small subunit ribosomal protein S6
VKRKYETVFILNPNLGEEGLVSTADKIKSMVETSASLVDFETWGSRRLAYEISNQKEGHYFLMHFESDVQFPAELERVLKITEGVMRFLVIRMDE